MVRSGVQEKVAMRLSGHVTRSIFDRYNTVSEQDLADAVRKLQRFQDAAEPAGQPAHPESFGRVGSTSLGELTRASF